MQGESGGGLGGEVGDDGPGGDEPQEAQGEDGTVDPPPVEAIQAGAPAPCGTGGLASVTIGRGHRWLSGIGLERMPVGADGTRCRRWPHPISPGRPRTPLRPDPSPSEVSPWDRLLVPTVMTMVGALSTWGLTRHGLWLDEAISLGATNQLRETLSQTAGTMGLYYLLLDPWMAVVGTSVGSMRSLSVLFAAGAAGFAMVLIRRIVTRPEAWMAGLVLGASPGLVRYAQEARSYALVALFTS